MPLLPHYGVVLFYIGLVTPDVPGIAGIIDALVDPKYQSSRLICGSIQYAVFDEGK